MAATSGRRSLRSWKSTVPEPERRSGEDGESEGQSGSSGGTAEDQHTLNDCRVDSGSTLVMVTSWTCQSGSVGTDTGQRISLCDV